MLNNNNYFFCKNETLTILQLTDLHLFKVDSLLHGTNTNKRLKKLVDNIKNNENIKYDLIFITGDMSQDMTEESYTLCSNIISQLNHVVYWIPGNHDDPKKAKKIFSLHKLFNSKKYLETKYWNFIFANTCLEGKDYGYIDQKEMKRIAYHIKTSKKEKNICIVMHHHPLPTQTPLLDEVILKNYADFLETLKGYPALKLIMCGHVHGDYSLSHESIKIETSPATCFQWVKGTHKIEIENYAGYVIYKMEKKLFEKYVFKYVDQ